MCNKGRQETETVIDVEVPDELYEKICILAKNSGKTVEEIASELVSKKLKEISDFKNNTK